MVEGDLSCRQDLPAKWDNEAGALLPVPRMMLSRDVYAKRWQSAKTAAEEVFKLGYVLMPGKTAVDYAKVTSMRDGNTESILEYNYLVGPTSWDKLLPGGDNDHGGRHSTQEMVESYELATTPWLGGYPD